MNSTPGSYDRPWRARFSAYSGESSATIPAGAPVVLSTADPAKIVLPSTSGTGTMTSLFAGVCTSPTTPGGIANVVARGYVANARIVVRTRAASTDSFASVASRPAGAYYTLDTKNGFVYSADTVASQTPGIILLENLASVASVASNSTLTDLVSYANVKAWVRALI
jgi:hypothetical protein